jgi:uncharacterized membrane protein YphA (DoxX/SURF4 family)
MESKASGAPNTSGGSQQGRASPLARRIAKGGVWVVVVLEMLSIGAAGFAKFAASEVWTGLFVGWGYPRGFTFVVGAVEVLGALALLAPRLASYAAGGLIVVMVGALATVLLNDTQLGPIAPTLHLIGLSIVLRARWARRWNPRG